MIDKQYITISEFAKRTGVSKQAIYSRLDKGLKQFVQVVDNKKMLNIKALDLYNSQGTVNQPCSTFNQPCSSDKLLDTLSETINELREQLKIKDNQIETLTKLLDQQQRLQALQQDNKKRLTDEQTTNKKSIFTLFKKQ